MGWRDRDYNRGNEAISEFFGNPASILAWALPFGTWFGSRVRLHFWLLLTFLFFAVDALHTNSWANAGICAALVLACLLLHEFGHRICAEWTGGHHVEFVLWPAGGMMQPTTVPQPWPFFVAHFGGMLANIVLATAGFTVLTATNHFHFAVFEFVRAFFLNPVAALGSFEMLSPLYQHAVMTWPQLVLTFCTINMLLVGVNLLPYFWFDGGYLFQAILWPWTGAYQSINIVCIAGMVLAVPMFVLSLYGLSFLGMIMWVLLFSSAYMRRRALQAEGPAQLQDAIAYSASLRDVPPARRRKISRRWFKWARRRASQEQRDEALIDAILDKVHNKGLHSLTRSEKRVLRRATERQRARDRADPAR